VPNQQMQLTGREGRNAVRVRRSLRPSSGRVDLCGHPHDYLQLILRFVRRTRRLSGRSLLIPTRALSGPILVDWIELIAGRYSRRETVVRTPNHVALARHLHAYLRLPNAHARHPDVLAAQPRQRAKIRSERRRRWADPSPVPPRLWRHGSVGESRSP
jgi:hypothetical protein